MMKKFVAVLLSMIMVLGLLTGCGNTAPASSTPTPASNAEPAQNNDPAPAPQEADTPAAPALPQGHKLGVIDWSALGLPLYVAALGMEKDLCATTGAELVTTTLSGYDDAAFMAAYEYLIDQGCNGCVVTTFSEGPISLIADMMEEAGVDWFLANRQITDPDLKAKVFGMDHFVGNCFCSEEDNAYDMVRQLHEKYGVQNLAVLGLTQGDLNGDLRDKGIARACEEFGVTLLTETRGIKTVDDVTNSVEGIIASYPELDGIFIVGGTVTNGALAGAAQALANHGMSDKVSIAMIDIAGGMSAYMGEGQPLKLVAGGNTIMDVLFSTTSLINHAMGVNVDAEPYVIGTHMMNIFSIEDANDYDEYIENTSIPMIAGEKWFETIVGKTVDEIQAFSDNFSIAYAKSLRG